MSDGKCQDAVFALLADPATHGGNMVKRIDTHAATVFLAGQRAFKVKRAVRFPFLDFSTLDQRKSACEEELRINRAFAPDIYRRVVPITREANGRLKLEGGGTPVEWALEMRRFDENATLDRLAQAGKVDVKLASALGCVVAALHAGAEVVEAEPWIAALGDYIEQNEAAFRERTDLFPSIEIEALTTRSRAAHARIRPLLVERGHRGLIRRLHGDLHLGNIVLLDGQPVLFDAIEFSPLIASGDVLYDLAFLLMDLVERGHKPAANVVFNRYLIETKRVEDLDGLATLPLFLSVRAAIRAMVTVARLKHAGSDQLEAIAHSARVYFDFSRRFIEPPPPRLLAVGGLSGTGKSVLAYMLASEVAPDPGAVVLRSDIERKALLGKREHEKLPQDAYSPAMTARVYATIADKARRAISAGHSTILDAVFAKPQERAAAAASAEVCGVPFRGLFLDADLTIRVARLATRSGDASDADAAVARLQETYDLGALDWTRIHASGTPEETFARVRDALNQ
jgi:aminoglycoside phosphotransferase family enzyme/predicted kinase